MGQFCFVHAADLHLDTPFEGFDRISPDVRAALRDASLEAFDALVELALARDAAFVVIAGDIYDGAERGVRAQIRFRDGLARLSERGIATFVVHGNHDPVGEGWTAIRQWPEQVTVFGTQQVEAVGIERGGERLATVHGISFERRDVSENLAARFQRGAVPGLHVGLLHCNVDGAGGHANYAPCTRADLEAAGLDYWALGHVHAHRVLLRGDCWAVYPGNLQGRSAKPSERGAKGAVVVEVDGSRVTGVEHVALDRVRFVEVAVDAEALSDLGALANALEVAGEQARAANQGRALVLRARIEGRSALRPELVKNGALEGLRDALRDGACALRPLLWWDRLDDATRPVLDRDALRKAGDFRAALLEEAEELAAAPEELAALLDELPERVAGVALAALAEEGAADASVPSTEAADPRSAAARLVAEAERLALDALAAAEEAP